MKKLCFLFVGILFSISTFSFANGDLLSISGTLSSPEAVVYDSDRDVLYVSLMNGTDPRDGSIAKMTPAGEVIDSKWIEHLEDPKGMKIIGDKLYVTDNTVLLEIDIDQKKVVKRYTTNATFLNDITVDQKGNIYVSDTVESAIYRLGKNDRLERWLFTKKLEHPNGLYVEGNTLYIASWGTFEGIDGFLDATPGRLLKVNLKNKKITRITKQSVGSLDGIMPFGKKYFLSSDWVNGRLVLINRETGEISKTVNMKDVQPNKVGQGIGDFAYSPKSNKIYAPMVKHNHVLMLSTLYLYK